jgi:Na+/phosphate symporter
LASNTKKREGKTMSSLGLLFNLFIIIIFIIAFGVAVPSPQVFHNRRRKRRIDDGLRGLKTHGNAHLMLALL